MVSFVRKGAAWIAWPATWTTCAVWCSSSPSTAQDQLLGRLTRFFVPLHLKPLAHVGPDPPQAGAQFGSNCPPLQLSAGRPQSHEVRAACSRQNTVFNYQHFVDAGESGYLKLQPIDLLP